MDTDSDAVDCQAAVDDAVRAVAAARVELADAERERDVLIRVALAKGEPVTAVAEWAGLAVSRIYQIRDGTR